MPIYAYTCGACGHEFELRQSFSAEPQQPCPQCASVAQRRIHAVGVIYKGTGFYTTDYARKSTSPAPSSSSKSSSEKASADKPSTDKSASSSSSGSSDAGGSKSSGGSGGSGE